MSFLSKNHGAKSSLYNISMEESMKYVIFSEFLIKFLGSICNVNDMRKRLISRPGVNFINIKCANFSYKFFWQSQNVTRENYVCTKKFVHITLMKLTTGVRSISSSFFEQLLYMQIPKAQKRVTSWLSFLRFWDLSV
jgi:hypothetical protein